MEHKSTASLETAGETLREKQLWENVCLEPPTS